MFDYGSKKGKAGRSGKKVVNLQSHHTNVMLETIIMNALNYLNSISEFLHAFLLQDKKNPRVNYLAKSGIYYLPHLLDDRQ